MKEVKLRDGVILNITVAPFSDSKALYQALLSEFETIDIKSAQEIAAALKDVFCRGFSSTRIEACIWKCIERCSLKRGDTSERITMDTFEPVEMRELYIKVCFEVAKENVSPFMKSLYAEFQQFFQTIENTPA